MPATTDGRHMAWAITCSALLHGALFAIWPTVAPPVRAPAARPGPAPIEVALLDPAPPAVSGANPTPDPTPDTVAVNPPPPAPAAQLPDPRSSAPPDESAPALPTPIAAAAVKAPDEPAAKPAARRPKPARKSARQPAPRAGAPAGRTRQASRAPAASVPPEPAATPTQAQDANIATRESARQHYLAALQRALARQRFYPLTARRRGLTGTATVRFSIGADGRFGAIGIVASSGAASLDQAAVATVRRLGRFAPLPEDLGLDRLVVAVPIDYRLE